VLDERFATNERGWPNDPASTAWLQEGVYRLMARFKDDHVAVGPPRLGPFADLTIQATFRKLGGPGGGGYGLILRDQGPLPRDGRSQIGNYYVFECGDRGEYGIWRREVNRWVDLIPWTPHPACRTGTASNDLAVQAVGPRFTFLINGVQVASVQDSALTSGNVGVYLGGDNNEAAAERFVVQVAQ
jgi:hypothetical protein